MSSSDLLTATWDQLAELATTALRNNDLQTLRQLDTAFHHFFFNEVRRGSEETRAEFVLGMIRILESAEARAKPRADEVQQLLTRWEHLNLLTEAFRRNVDAVDGASNLIRSREHADRLVALVAASGAGIPAGDLAEGLGISPPHLSKLLRELEQCDVIERHPAGRKVYVCLGLVGQLLVEREQSILDRAPTPSAQELEGLFPGPILREPISITPRSLLS